MTLFDLVTNDARLSEVWTEEHAEDATSRHRLDNWHLDEDEEKLVRDAADLLHDMPDVVVLTALRGESFATDLLDAVARQLGVHAHG